MPALLIKKSIFEQLFYTNLENCYIDYLSPRSSMAYEAYILGLIFLISLITSSSLALSLAPMIMLQLLSAKSRTVYLPIPVLPPVMIAVFPVRSFLALQTPPDV